MTELELTFPRFTSRGAARLAIAVEHGWTAPGIECRFAAVAVSPYLVSGGRVQAYPLLLAVANTSAKAG